jgi:hypothetical protein
MMENLIGQPCRKWAPNDLNGESKEMVCLDFDTDGRRKYVA